MAVAFVCSDQAVDTPGGPISRAERITNLDTVRGVATLGILLMNVVSYGLPIAGYFNVDAVGSDQWYDRLVGLAGEVIVDQKTMALFSLLFGVGIVVFADRAAIKGRRPGWLSLWRNLLLLGIGVLHGWLWDGDVLRIYAVCAPFLLLLRNRRPRTLYVLGGTMVIGSAVWAWIAQVLINGSPIGAESELGDLWFVGAEPIRDTAGIYFLADFFLRSLGMMLIGVGLYRSDIAQGTRGADFYRSMVRYGFLIGLPLTIGGVIFNEVNGWSAETGLVGLTPNTFATIPMAMAYLGIITLWNQRGDTDETAWHRRIRAVGRMALTNYLMQTVLGIVVLTVILDKGSLGRLGLLLFVFIVWAIQIAWSYPLLERFRFGPAEWLWRMATYRRYEPWRR